MFAVCSKGATTLFGLFAILLELVSSVASLKMSGPSSSATSRATPPSLTRPSLVEEALKSNDSHLYYFGLGSNMLRSKLENRSSRGKIDVISIEPAIVPDHRLAFNMRGFVPLEPAMGALEPVQYSSSSADDSPCPPLYPYHKPECHGALVKLTPDNYEKVMESEGISKNNPNPGYEEIVVTAIPYDTSKPPVQAIALRARPHVRLSQDHAPSVRYMTILRQGSSELGLKPCYQEYLANHPVQQTPMWLKHLAVHNLLFVFALNSGSPMSQRHVISRLQTWLLQRCYVVPTAPRLLQVWHQFSTGLVLLPGSIMGLTIRWYRRITKTEHSPFVKRILGLIHETPTTESSSSSSSSSTTTTAATSSHSSSSSSSTSEPALTTNGKVSVEA